jgi:hypothetical protein
MTPILLAAALAAQPIACNLSVFTKAQRTRHLELIAMLKSQVQELREQPDGYSFRYPAETIARLGEFTALESLCCPFIDFQLELEPQPGGPAWLRLLGRSEVKDFIRVEFRPLIELGRK